MRFVELPPPVPVPHGRMFQSGPLRIIVSIDVGLVHFSISCPDRYPTWDEIRDARYALLPNDLTMAMLLPPIEEYVNQHPFCFHLWQIVDPR